MKNHGLKTIFVHWFSELCRGRKEGPCKALKGLMGGETLGVPCLKADSNVRKPGGGQEKARKGPGGGQEEAKRRPGGGL